jgi:dipeptidase
MCDSVVAVGAETAAGLTLFGKNSDRQADEAQLFVQFVEASHPPQAQTQCTHIAIPQVPETYRVMGHSPWWVWGFEHGVNEYAVAIGNHSVFSNEPIEQTPGLIGMDLVRLGLERGRSAREALEVIAGLIEKHGQGGAAFGPDGDGNHNAFLLADPTEAWLLETSNRHWAARRTRLDGVSNHHSIGSDWEIGSRDLTAFARHEGWWSNGERLDVSAAYRSRDVPSDSSEGRRRRSRELLDAGSNRHDVATLQRLLRDHCDGDPNTRGESTANGDRRSALCTHGEPNHATAASIVAPLPAELRAPWPVWVSFGTPCTGIFLPIYLHGAIPAALARGARQAERDSAWWTFKKLGDAAGEDPERHTPMVRAEWTKFEDRLEGARLTVEGLAREASVADGGDFAAQLVTDFMERTTAEALECAEVLCERIG